MLALGKPSPATIRDFLAKPSRPELTYAAVGATQLAIFFYAFRGEQHPAFHRPAALSTANQALLPLVYQDVGDDRRFQRFRLAARCIIPACQFLQFFAARWVSEQHLQFRCPLLERFLCRHELSFPNCKGCL
jgi:hypothetical protein